MWKLTSGLAIIFFNNVEQEKIRNLLTNLTSLFVREFFSALDFIIALFWHLPVIVVSINLKCKKNDEKVQDLQDNQVILAYLGDLLNADLEWMFEYRCYIYVKWYCSKLAPCLQEKEF